MNFIGRIEELLKSRKIQKSKMLGDLNLSVNSFTNWKNRGTIPSGDTLQRIADYFGVTVDYLLEEREKTFWENYSKLCLERGESPNSIAAQLGYSSGSVTAWKQGRVPKFQTLEVIAKHFGVSVEYLLKEPTNMFWRTFLDLCVAVDKSPTAVGTELGFSRATVSNWRYGGLPRDFALVKIADYFGVTVDYLLGKEKTQQTDSIAIQQAYSRAPEEIKIAVRKLLDI